MCLVFLDIIGGTPDKLISEGLFCPLFFCWFWVFIGIIGGTPDKRFYEGLFRRVLFYYFILGFAFSRRYRGEPLINVFLRVYFSFFLLLGFYRYYWGDP